MKLYDVSLLISEDLPTWPGDPSISMKRSSRLECGDTSNVTQLALGVHAGTHIDAPFHFEADGIGIDQLSVETLIGPCRLVALDNLSEGIDRYQLEQLDLKGVTRLLFKTSNSNWWQQGDMAFHEDFIYLSTDGAEYLVDQGVKLLGIDYLSIEKFKNKDHPTHHALLRNNIIIIEGLNLTDVPAGDYELIALPLKLKGADGAPTGVVLREMGRQVET